VKVSEELPSRKPNRVKGKDYSLCGVYFLTICTKERHELLGRIEEGETTYTEAGAHAADELSRIESIYPSVVVDTSIVMPNHVHLLLLLLNNELNPTISRIIQQWKGAVTKKAGFSLWQDKFHDHIVDTAKEYRSIRQYIQTNPARWETDCHNEKCRIVEDSRPRAESP